MGRVQEANLYKILGVSKGYSDSKFMVPEINRTTYIHIYNLVFPGLEPKFSICLQKELNAQRRTNSEVSLYFLFHHWELALERGKQTITIPFK